MIMKENKQIGFIYKNNESIDKIIKNGEVVFERGFLREKTSTTLPITFGGVGKDLKDYKVYGNTYQNSTSGKNLNIYPYDGRALANGITFTSNADGTLIIDGQNNNNGNSAFYFFNNSSNPRILEAGTYYFIPPSNTHVQYVIYDGTTYYNFNSNNNYHRTFQTSISAKTMYIQVSKGSTAIFNGLKVYPMLSTTVATEDDYEPYTGGQPSPNPDYPQEIVSCGDLITDTSDINYSKYKIPVNVNGNITNIYLDEPLRGIGEYSDYIDFVNGKIVRQIRKIILDGSENWARSYGNNLFNLQHYLDDAMFIVGYGLSNYYRYNPVQSGINANTKNGEFALQSSYGGNVMIKNTDYTVINDFKTWLSTHNTEILYPLATPTEESITLPNIPTIDGNNTLNIETEITPSQVYIKYKSNT